MSEIISKPSLTDFIQGNTTPEAQTELEANANKSIDDPTYDPEKGPLALFALYGPQLYSHVAQLSNRQLRRLINALVTYPLENVEINKKNPIELSAYNIANEMITARFLLTAQQGYDEMERRKAANEEHKKALENSTEAKNAFDAATKQAAELAPLDMVSFKEEKS